MTMPPSAFAVANSNKSPLWLRWWGILWAIVTLLWLPIEDIDTTKLVLVAAGWAIWLGIKLANGTFLAAAPWRFVWIGILSGFTILVFVFALVLFKAGMHRHGFLDFSFWQLGRVVRQTPWWVLAGGLAGGMIEIWHKQREESSK